MRVGLLASSLFVVLIFFPLAGCDEEDSTSARMAFCHAMVRNGSDLVLTVKMSQGGKKKTLRAGTECCTPCVSVSPDEPVSLVLSDDNGELYSTQTTLAQKNHYILLADVLEQGMGPSLGLSNLTEERRSCDDYVPPPWKRCGSVK
jgi:hypothetical protein